MKQGAVITVMLLMTIVLKAQNIVRADSSFSDLHKANMGRIRFMAAPIPAGQVQEKDYLDSFRYRDNRDFGIRVYLANSLTNYLHRLSPSITVEDLVRKGNYQFLFLVDGKPVYRENLHPGAGTPESKNKSILFRIPLLSTAQEDSWGRFLWNRFILQGGEDALTEGIHTLRIEIRPYLNTSAVISGDIIAQGEVQLVISKPPVTEQQVKIQAIQPGSDWPTDHSGFDTVKIRELNKKILQNDFKNITSILVIRSGKLLLEEYFTNAARETLHDTRSVGKTFTSALMGIAIQDGYIGNEKKELKDFYPVSSFMNYSKTKEKVTIHDLLTMSSGFDGSDDDEDSPGNEEKMYPAPNWVRFALDLPMDTSRLPGERWSYFTAGVVLLGDILHQKVPGGLESYAEKKFFSPLGIHNYRWEYTPQKVVNTAGGLRMRSLDLARVGQLYTNRGNWNGKQVLPAHWTVKSMSRQISLPGSGSDHYGYLFWNTRFAIGNTQHEVYYLSGNGGNKVFIFTDIPIVVVITSTAYNQPYAHRQVNKMMQEYILPAVYR